MSLIATTSLWMRNGLAILGGLGVGSAVNMALITLNTAVLFPMPQGVSFDDKQAFADYIASLPATAYIMVFAAHYGQAVIGGALAAWLASSTMNRSSVVGSCYAVGVLTFLAALINTATLPVPKWTWLELPLFPVLSYYTAEWVWIKLLLADSSKK